jgi:hypothetical protein
LAATTPILTIARAFANIAETLDLGGQTFTIQLTNGTYAAGLAIQGPWTSGGTLVLQGNATTPSSVVITPGAFGAFGVYVSAPCRERSRSGT